ITGVLVDLIGAVHCLTIDADDDTLRAEPFTQARNQFRIGEGRRGDRNRLGTLAEDFFGIRNTTNAAGYAERNIEHAGHSAHPGAVDRAAFGARGDVVEDQLIGALVTIDRKSTRLNSSHVKISYAVFCLKKKK